MAARKRNDEAGTQDQPLEVVPVDAQETGIHEQIRADRQLYGDNEQVPERHLGILGINQIPIYRDYARGVHRMQFTPDQERILQGILGNRFCDNVCHTIIAEATNRLAFQGFASEDNAVSQWLSDFYTRSRMNDRSGEIHYDTLRDGDHAIGVNWDDENGVVCLYREPWWDGLRGTFIGYDVTDEPLYAVKDWHEMVAQPGANSLSQAIRRVIYYDDRFERWISWDAGNSWQAYQLPDDDAWPVPWLDYAGKPLGIPFIHFMNSGRGSGKYGSSEMAGGVVGFQDQINDLQYIMSGAARFNGYQIIWGSGVTLESDPENPGKFVPIDAGPGTFLHSQNADARFGRIEPGDPTGVLAIYLQKCKSVSRMTQTPLHSITGGDWPSGEALMRAEQPAVGKADRQVAKLSGCWVAVACLAIHVQNTFGAGANRLQEDVKKASVSARFAPTERRDPLTRSLIVQNLGNRISDREALRIMGYSDGDADRIIQETQDEQRESANTAVIAFSRGIGRGTELPGRGPQNGPQGDGTQPQPGGNNGGSNPAVDPASAGK